MINVVQNNGRAITPLDVQKQKISIAQKEAYKIRGIDHSKV